MDLNFKANTDWRLFTHELQSEESAAETLLWYHLLKSKKMGGCHFHRRYTINDYSVNFICLKLKLIIEITGDIDWSQSVVQQKREADLQKIGYFILKIADSKVINNLELVKEEIVDTIELLKENNKLRH